MSFFCTREKTQHALCCLLFQHKDAYQVILDGVKGGAKEKRLAAQFIPKFFKHFPELADSAINAQLDLCEDEDVSVRTSGRQFVASCYKSMMLCFLNSPLCI